MRRFVVLVHIHVEFRKLLVLTTIRILFVRVVVVVFMFGCCDAVVTDLVVVEQGTALAIKGRRH